ncbi:type VI secretion system baseplate subunit TssK [Trinickia fusca]|uniref:Type VI secretion system baseplate subunit TssK n=1 Tax=Trinickia fusca TaxID=2419777 RepID=A0A494X861_9BURK|nr:type VI secretion system baseplate subunit TssK [Trinickia fusca]RKP44536.1 type VI secretion system baseplate subunit TssK [Trinickia fusca]
MNDTATSPFAAPVLRERVVWSEGMFLRPQHFQQLERYFERYVHLRCAPMQCFHWGFASLSVDAEALANGKVALAAAAGVMPDGTPFDFARFDDAPLALEIGPEVKDATVVLALPAWRGDGVQVSFDSASVTPLARFVAHESEIADVNEIGLEPALVQLGRLRLRLMLDSELGDDWHALGMLRVIERRGDRQLVLDEGYIPPMLNAHAHPVLTDYIRELHRLLNLRSEVIASRLAEPGRAGVSEVADFLLLQLVNRYLAVTWHTEQMPRVHPEPLFREWLKLACDFATFTSETRRPPALPVYDHDDLRRCFGELFAELRRSLSTVLDQSALQIALQDGGNGVRVAVVPDPQLREQAGFILAVRADLPAETVCMRFPSQIKLGPVERIRDLVYLQLPGIAVHALPVAPRQIPYHAGCTYFEVDKGSELWRQLERSAGLALHLAGDFPGLAMELWAIRG